MIRDVVKADANQAKEGIGREILASFGCNVGHGNPQHENIKAFLGGAYCHMDVYEKATRILR